MFRDVAPWVWCVSGAWCGATIVVAVALVSMLRRWSAARRHGTPPTGTAGNVDAAHLALAVNIARFVCDTHTTAATTLIVRCIVAIRHVHVSAEGVRTGSAKRPREASDQARDKRQKVRPMGP